MIDVIIDTLIDILKIIPFLFICFLLMEFIEHKINESSKEKIVKSGRFGPFIGSFLGLIPQCGFSAAATNMYVTRVISLGTLISIYLSTSDEMLPILIVNKVDMKLILYILLIKVVVGMICGFLIDLFLRRKEHEHIKDFCDEKHCDCEHSILISSLRHTFSITLFLMIALLILNFGVNYLGENKIGSILSNNSYFEPFMTSLIGLIPNCASSVIITSLFIKGTLSFGSLISGLLTNSGVGLLILFKVNKNIKENMFILFLVYFIGVLSGLFINWLGVL